MEQTLSLFGHSFDPEIVVCLIELSLDLSAVEYKLFVVFSSQSYLIELESIRPPLFKK